LAKQLLQDGPGCDFHANERRPYALVKPGYNWQISTYDQFILNYSIHQTATDTQTLPSHLAGFNTLYGYMPDTVTADAGYGSESNYMFLEENFTPVKAILSNSIVATLTSHRISGLGWGDLPWHSSTKSKGKTQT
jgi:hypothetical protein